MTGPVAKPWVPGFRRQRGYALLIVLWSLVFLSFLMAQVLAVGRTSVALAGNILLAAQARAADDGAIQTAAFHLLATGPDAWRADGALHPVVLGGIDVALRIDSLAGMVNPNTASAGLLAALLQVVAVPPAQARALAAAIVAWRGPPASAAAGAAELDEYRRAGLNYGPPGKPFLILDELNQVVGMTPDIFARLAPHMSLYQSGATSLAAADPAVRAAMTIAGPAGATNNAAAGSPAVAITACAEGPATLCRHAVIRVASAGAQPPFSVLALHGDQ